ncbi:MAG: helix-turn-helix transcriptional regulator [Clostridia bacterium]|nr:helix-turn-helix transcriptional regulator [Clostridia bacterium]
MATFSEIFRALRKDKQLTQEQIAEVLGVSPQAISRWENSLSYPDITQLPNIASYFETSVDELLGIKKVVKKQKMLYFQFRWQESADVINEHLDDGWIIKEMHTHPLDEGQHPEGVVVLEKTIFI